MNISDIFTIAYVDGNGDMRAVDVDAMWGDAEGAMLDATNFDGMDQSSLCNGPALPADDWDEIPF